MRKKKDLKAKPSEKILKNHDRVTSVADLMKIASDIGKGTVGSRSILIPEKDLPRTIDILKNQ